MRKRRWLTVRRCGRLDDHPEHEWTSRWNIPAFVRSYWCTGHVEVEGGHDGRR